MQREVIQGYRLSRQQERLWLLQSENPETVYHAQCAVMLEGPLDMAALEASLANLVSGREILRTSFQNLPGMLMSLQCVEQAAPAPPEFINLSGGDERTQMARVEEMLAEAGARAFDYTRAPLLRAALVARSAHRHLLLLTLPALVVDATTLKILVRELARGYGAHPQDREGDGEHLQYADLSEFLNELLESEETEVGRAYWRGRVVPANCVAPAAADAQTRAGGGFAPG